MAGGRLTAGPTEMRARKRRGRHPLLERLRTPEEAREAFLLHEILGPPRAHR